MKLQEIISKNPEGIVARSYHFAKKAHAGQKRKTGDPYFSHLVAAAETLSEWNLDDATIAAGLLHDTVEDTGVSLEAIKKEFGDEVTFLVDGVTKLGLIKYRGAKATVENLRKMIIAVSEDLRVIFVKLADRLHNMRTLHALPPQKQKRIALETDEIYAPIAYRLGMGHISGELHDLAFPYLYPKEHAWVLSIMKERTEDLYHYLATLKPHIEKLLQGHGIVPQFIDSRVKRVSSLYQKLLRRGMDIEKIYDLIAMRIIVANTEECYAVLGLIHELWPPLPGSIKDYIAMPKPNGYRSLHTTVIGPKKKIVELQIRTAAMHEEDEHGIAAHWLYKHKSNTGEAIDQERAKREIRWVKQLRTWQDHHTESGENAEDFLEAMKVDFFSDRIFVITPKGEVIDLPAGSTPVDFAYNIHTEVGNSAVGAKVNGKIVPLNYELHSGDLIEILIQRGKKPSKDWAGFVKTSIARDHIRAAFRDKKFPAPSRKMYTKTELKITAQDRVGLIKDITAVISKMNVNILHLNAGNPSHGEFPMDKFEIALTDRHKLEKLVVKLKKIKDVKEVSYKLK